MVQKQSMVFPETIFRSVDLVPQDWCNQQRWRCPASTARGSPEGLPAGQFLLQLNLHWSRLWNPCWQTILKGQFICWVRCNKWAHSKGLQTSLWSHNRQKLAFLNIKLSAIEVWERSNALANEAQLIRANTSPVLSLCWCYCPNSQHTWVETEFDFISQSFPWAPDSFAGSSLAFQLKC